MRSHFWILAASGRLVCAGWGFGQKLEYHAGDVASLLPRETRASGPDGVNGWTPRPTEAPPTELVRRRQEWANLKRQDSSNTWINDKTCGWLADVESEPFVCAPEYTCATNSDNVVDCTSSGDENPFSTFFTVCFDYSAYQNGLCDKFVPKTGCCMTESIGECITYVWPGSTERSMYRCYSERRIVTMLETPSGLETSTSTTSTSSTTSETSQTEEASTTATDDEANETETSTPSPRPEKDGNNTGAIVGGVVGGVAGIALIAGAIAFFIIRSRKNAANGNIGGGAADYSAVAPNDTAYHPGSPMPSSVAGYPQMSQAGYYNPNAMGNNNNNNNNNLLNPPDTPYLSSTTPPPVSPGYNTNSYYDPPKDAADQQQPHQQPGYAPYPGAPTPPQGQGLYPGAGGGYPQHQQYPQQVSELDTSTAPMGQQSNPAEMAGDTPARH
ncbi:hypothetical protein L209DRAFT_673857 [Thermothelomyces heterothallicus CBS 203.75]